MLTDDACYAAMLTRDRRFDGVFFVAVSTTGIYCRPICTARTPGRTRCTFYATPVLCEAAGYRACFRCRPELAPGNAEVDAVDALVASAARRIAEGALNAGSVDDLAAELGVSARHLRRATEAKLGVSPIDLAQSRRLALAKQLLQDTALPLTQIAFAAGFGSVRRFNAAFLDRMGKPPSAMRRAPEAAGGLTLRLDYRPPYEWTQLLAFLRMRAIPGVETVGQDVYRRTVRIGDHVGTIEVRHAADRPSLLLSVSSSLTPVLMPLVARVRRMFDVDARPDVIGEQLGRDPLLAPLVAARPGLRLPGAIDPFEAAIRALLGQQVSVAGATTLAGRFAASFGTPYGMGAASSRGDDADMRRTDGEAGADVGVVFPTAADVAAATPREIAAIGLPSARSAAIHGFAVALATNQIALEGELEAFVARAVALPGVGPWTAHYLAMRALHLPDAFPAADLGIKKALAASPRECEARAEAWRPFRSYAVMHLWTSLGDADARARDEDPVVAGRPAVHRRARRSADRPVLTRARPAERDAGARRARARRDGAPAARVLRR